MKPPWLYDRRYEFAVAQIPKSGMTSISSWIGKDAEKFGAGDPRLSKVKTRVAFIRNPLSRLISSYSFFYWMHEKNDKNFMEIPLNNYESFVDHVLDPEIEDEHWMPQTEIVGDVPTIYYRFENILEHFSKYRPGYFPHENKSSWLPTNAYRLPEIVEKYKYDFEIWMSNY